MNGLTKGNGVENYVYNNILSSTENSSRVTSIRIKAFDISQLRLQRCMLCMQQHSLILAVLCICYYCILGCHISPSFTKQTLRHSAYAWQRSINKKLYTLQIPPRYHFHFIAREQAVAQTLIRKQPWSATTHLRDVPSLPDTDQKVDRYTWVTKVAQQRLDSLGW